MTKIALSGVFSQQSTAMERMHNAQYREHEHKLNMSGIEMPMKCTKQNIAKFKRQNDISVSVYGVENSRVDDNKDMIPGFAYTLHVATEVKTRHVDLLLIGNGATQHYCWIKNFSALVSK